MAILLFGTWKVPLSFGGKKPFLTKRWKEKTSNQLLGGGFKYFLFSPLNLGKIPIWTNIFQRGLKPPTSKMMKKKTQISCQLVNCFLGDCRLRRSMNGSLAAEFGVENFRTPKMKTHTLPETNMVHLKITPWKRRFLLETIIFRCYVSFRECRYNK